MYAPIQFSDETERHLAAVTKPAVVVRSGRDQTVYDSVRELPH